MFNLFRHAEQFGIFTVVFFCVTWYAVSYVRFEGRRVRAGANMARRAGTLRRSATWP
jgi:hypothetical protein